ncbi:TPR repeat region-containing protein [Mycolicibacterium lutetiense]
MALSMADVDQWQPDKIDEVGNALAERARTGGQTAQELRGLQDMATWQGDAGDAAKHALEKSASHLETSAQNDFLTSMATKKSAQDVRTVKNDLKAIVDYAAAQPAVPINLDTNTVTKPDTTGWDDEEIKTLNDKIAELEDRIVAMLATATETDSDLGRVMQAAAGGDPQTPAEQGSGDGHSVRDGQLTPEELARLKENATLTPEQLHALARGDLVLPASQLEYLNSLARSMDGMNIQQTRAMMDNLDKTNPSASRDLMNAMQMLSDPKVKAAGADWKGGLDRLPDGVKNVAQGLPADRGNIHVQDRQDLAAIMMKGSPEFMHGTDLDRAVLKQTEQLLQGAPAGTFKQGWEHSADLALKDLLPAVGRDHWAVHDLVAGADGKSPNNEFISNALRHQWDDGGAAAGALAQGLAPVATDATQVDAATRAGETVFAFDKYIVDHPTEFTNMFDRIPMAPGEVGAPDVQGDQTFGKAHPELVQALAEANAPFLDDMMKHDWDNTHGFGNLETTTDENGNLVDRGDANMPKTRDLLSTLNSDPVAASTLKGAVEGHHFGLQQDYVNSLANHDTPDVDALRADGRLQGLNDVALSESNVQQAANEYSQAQLEYEQKEARWEAITTIGGSVPHVSDALDAVGKVPGADGLLQDMFGAGDAPKAPDAPHIPLQQSGPNLYQIAEQLYENDYGDKNIFPNGFPTYEAYEADMEGDVRNKVEQYLGDRVTGDLTKSEVAYQGTLPHDPPKAGQ